MIIAMGTQSGVRRVTQMGSKPAQERAVFRRWQRYRLNLPIRLIVTREDSTRIADGRANDISEGGMLIFAGMELRSEDKVMVEFTPPYSSDPIRAPGIVRHRRGYNYGVEFSPATEVDEQETERLRKMMSLAAGPER